MAAMSERDPLAGCVEAARKRILSVGSGDGSQQAAIVSAGHSNVVVTFYDSKEEVLSKYPTAASVSDFLQAQKVKTVYEVDATHLSSYDFGLFDICSLSRITASQTRTLRMCHLTGCFSQDSWSPQVAA